MESMTAAEATVSSLIAHGIGTMYALPGVHNDWLFDALFNASDRIRVVHSRHEQGAAYMALGAALATNKPQPYAVVPGPGLLNTSAALLTAYSMNAPVLALIGQIPDADIGKGIGHLHEVRDQAGIIARLVDFSARIRSPDVASRYVAEAIRSMSSGRPGPAALECAIDMWGRRGATSLQKPLPVPATKVDEDAVLAAAKKLGAAKRVLIICGGGAQDSSAEVNQLSEMLQAPVLAYRRGRGVLDGRSPFSVTLPLGHELWGKADAVLAVGTHMYIQHIQWGIDDKVDVIRIDADAEEPTRVHQPAVALYGDAKPILKALVNKLGRHNSKRASRLDEMKERQAYCHARMQKQIGPQIAYLEAIRDELPEKDGILVDEVTQLGFAARLAFPVYKPRTFLSPGYQDNLGWGFATALGAADARRDAPVVAISGDGGFMFTANEMATAVRHRIPLTTVVFADGAFGNVRRIQQENYGNHVIASDLANPDFVRLAEAFGATGERARNPEELRGALRRAIAQRDGPTLIEVPVGPFPSPWQFIQMPKNRGRMTMARPELAATHGTEHSANPVAPISTSDELAAACGRFAKQSFVTVDTEFLRETTYPLLCVAQIASTDEAVVIDMLAAGLDLKPFLDLMANENVVKVFHAARQDIEIVWHMAELIPHPVFDTQVAAMVLGYGDSISYDQLVARVTGGHIDKSNRFTDWSRRPLSEAQLVYAVSDVTHLRDIYLKLKEELEKRSRIDWVSDEMDVLTSPETYRAEPQNAWRRLKTRVRKPKELAVLMEIAAWREREAQERDVPRGRVLKDEILGDLATQAPTSIERLGNMRSIPKGFERSRWGQDVVDAVQRGIARDPKTLPILERQRQSANTSAIVELLKVLLRMTSERHGVAAKVIATADDLDTIANDDNADVPALKGWRRELFGEKALGLEHGKLSLAIEKGRVVARDRDPPA